MSTDNRWLHLKTVSFTIDGDTVAMRDAIASDLARGSQVIGNSSETDDYANHFIQGVEIADTMNLSTYDLSMARWLATKRGMTGTFTATIPHAAESSTTTSFYIETATCGLAMVQNVSFALGRNEAFVGQVSLIFKSNGSSPGLRLRAFAGS